MNDTKELDQELRELKGFIADLKADRAAQKEKEQREAWTKYTSMSLVFIAVLAAIATQWSGKYSGRVLVGLNDSTFKQAQASDEWSYYQAKSVKQNLFEGLRDVAKSPTGTAADPATPKDDAFNAKIAKYEAEKKDVMQKAQQLEKERDAARQLATNASQHGGGMGMAISIFQIAIALGSICLVTKKRPLWYLALGLAVVATLKMVHVWIT
jgi:hypothetical protein